MNWFNEELIRSRISSPSSWEFKESSSSCWLLLAMLDDRGLLELDAAMDDADDVDGWCILLAPCAAVVAVAVVAVVSGGWSSGCRN